MRQLSIFASCLLLMLSLAHPSALDIAPQLITINLQDKITLLSESYTEAESPEFVLTISPSQITSQQLDFRYISIAPLEIDDKVESLTELTQMTLSAGKINTPRVPSDQLSKAISALRLHVGSEILSEVISIYFNGQYWIFDMISRKPGSGGIYRVTSEGVVSFENNNR